MIIPVHIQPLFSFAKYTAELPDILDRTKQQILAPQTELGKETKGIWEG